MAMNPLPPQAYTKETLMTAFAWLQGQSDSIKEMAANPDILVGLYLKAKLQGEEVLERPSIQNFKNELKSLAGMMGEFSPKVEVPASPLPPQPQPQPMPQTQTQPQSQPQIPSLDLRSTQMIHEIKERFNLSSDTEVLRLLISIGFQKVKTSL